MAITFDAQGNLVDTEGNINFFNTSEEQVFPRQGLEPLYPNFGAPMVNNTSLTPDVSSSNLTSLIPLNGINNLRVPESGINTLRFPEFNPIDTQKTPQREYPFVPFDNASVDASTAFPNNNLMAAVSAKDLARYSLQKDLIDQQTYEDAMETTLMGSEMTPYEYEQLLKGNITQPGTYIG